ncbi:hypothetical protein CYMTET_19787 [Cymbomonas tetramitiformis]|uniref:Major facilitator superfamily (MFS) profile domain-containing protein n=1 Tax=Cymbomonas tetramitiformis TaxID=36881 RepID=A0AAE0G5F5_9CHLO|nr:hypothetical protein CYMTET_19787 [Cymbomonas tetramitiformis]
MAEWAPAPERARMLSFSWAGSYLGTALAMPISSTLLMQVSWQSVFYFWGFFGFCWTALWITFSASRPTEHPFISQEEVAYISYHVQSKAVNGSKVAPLRPDVFKIFTSSAVWACIAGHTAFNWVIYMLLTELPSFMKVVLGMELAASGRLSGLPFLTLFVTQTAAGMAADWLVKKGHARVGHLLPSDVWLV